MERLSNREFSIRTYSMSDAGRLLSSTVSIRVVSVQRQTSVRLARRFRSRKWLVCIYRFPVGFASAHRSWKNLPGESKLSLILLRSQESKKSPRSTRRA
ncbi:hypothetical protein DV706_07305 [Natronorubrum bangense]|uniref:Uncharacterized protein n=2 Tax=Natronorubrum bangense TaxID=61858 RepID=L9WLI4_9EURY|nr:hypothetical protein C494_05523 [Natronorubrum bangense JCM 10635]QCC54311.1 hypothetical protein DV706_07305 [Natronorubrum bangense]